MHMCTRHFARYPLALANRSRDTAIKRHGQLHRDMRAIGMRAYEITREAGLGCWMLDQFGGNAGVAKPSEPGPCGSRVRIFYSCDNAGHTGADQPFAAGRTPL